MSDGAIEAGFYSCLGRNIEAKRKERRLTQTDVGRLLGVHRNTIMRWESGDGRVDMWMILRLADALNCNHLMLLPPREYTWGTDFGRILAERDPGLTRKERCA